MNNVVLADSGRSANRYVAPTLRRRHPTAPGVPCRRCPRPGSNVGDVHIPHLQAQHLRRPQTGEQHQPGDRPAPVRADATQQRRCLGTVQAAGQSPRFPHPQPGLRPVHVRQQPGPLRGRRPAGRRHPGLIRVGSPARGRLCDRAGVDGSADTGHREKGAARHLSVRGRPASRWDDVQSDNDYDWTITTLRARIRPRRSER